MTARNRKVFVVHGHDSAAKKQLKKLLLDAGMEPVILDEQPDNGMTIIEKFEHFARKCVFALVLLTPDDKQASQLTKKQAYRARQNVIFEMGWFFQKLGRHRTRLLHRGSVELPSDITGIIYIEFKSKIPEAKEKILAALRDGGLK